MAALSVLGRFLPLAFYNTSRYITCRTILMTSLSITTSSLGFAILGLLQHQPASGYDLRKTFSSSSMKTYSDSPGAIYPALRRLEKQGFIRGTVEDGNGLRRRQVFRPTTKGVAEIKSWITSPVTREELTWGQQSILLRFAFSEHIVGPDASLALLKSLKDNLEPHLRALHEEFAASKDMMPVSGRLAFECGIRGTESFLQWTNYAISTYERREKQKGTRQ